MSELIIAKTFASYIFKRTVEVWGEHNVSPLKWKIVTMLTNGLPIRVEKNYHVSVWDYNQSLINLDEAEPLLKSDEHWDQHSKHTDACIEQGKENVDPWIKSGHRTRFGAHIWVAERTVNYEDSQFLHMKHTYAFAASLDELENVIKFL